MNVLIDYLSTWLFKNKLSPNVNKTKLMLFTVKQVDVFPNIYFNNTILEWTNTFKYLGILLDSKLNFGQHCNCVLKRLSQAYDVIYSIHSFIPRNVLIKIYYSIVYPILIQNIIIWGGVARSNKINIIIMLNKIMRCILNVKSNQLNIPLISTTDTYKKLKLLKFDDIYVLKFIHFVFYKNDKFFNDYFLDLLPTHNYETRNVRIQLPKVRLEVYKQFVIHKACKLINEIPESFLSLQSNNMLKKNFKEFCLNKY